MSEHPAFSSYCDRLREYIRVTCPCGAPENACNVPSSGGEHFNELALELFGLQYANNVPYRQLCDARKITPALIQRWQDIPAVPTAAFKQAELTSLPPSDRPRVFHSSGTTAHKPSRHIHNEESLEIYETSLLPWFNRHLIGNDGDSKALRIISLTPQGACAPNSSLVHMFETLAARFAHANSTFAGAVQTSGSRGNEALTKIDTVWTLDLDRLFAALNDAISSKTPVLLLGTAFNFVHLLDALASQPLPSPLPPGSRILETGGYKGRSRELCKPELHNLMTKLLSVPSSHIVCEYGMSELSSQAYDRRVGSQSDRVFHFPPWAACRIVSPETGAEVSDGETGLARVFDLANVRSVMAVQTEDLAIRRGRGFELIGRAVVAEPRGCSLMSVE